MIGGAVGGEHADPIGIAGHVGRGDRDQLAMGRRSSQRGGAGEQVHR